MSLIIQPQTAENIAFATAKRARILLKTRLDKMDSMIAQPSEEELDASILDAVSSFNFAKPASNISYSDAVSTVASGDQNLDYLILVGSCYHITRTIWDSWGHTGDELNLAILHEKDRTGEFQAMMDDFKAEFDEKAGDYKKSMSLVMSRASFISTSRTIGRGRGRGNRRGFKSAYRSC